MQKLSKLRTNKMMKSRDQEVQIRERKDFLKGQKKKQKKRISKVFDLDH